MNKINKEYVVMIILLFMVYFGYAVINLNYLVVAAAILCVIFFYQKNINFSFINISWIICIIISWLSLIFTLDIKRTLEFSIMITCLIIIKLIFDSLTNWQKIFIDLIWKFSFVHVFCTFLQFIFPSLFYFILNKLNIISIEVSKQFYQIGNYSGITEQTGVNAFFIATFIAISYCKILTGQKNYILNYILTTIAFFTLILTGKRGPLITVIIIIVILYLIHQYFNKRKLFKNIFVIFVTALICFIIIEKFSIAENFFEKFKVLENNRDISNGRYELWNNTLSYFNTTFFYGSGIAAIPCVIGEMTHNVYIQLLGELGIFGFFAFVSSFIISLFITLKKLFLVEKNKKSNVYPLMVSVFLQLYFLIYNFTGNPLYGHMFLTIYILAICLANIRINLKIKECN